LKNNKNSRSSGTTKFFIIDIPLRVSSQTKF
jgi:hypothetical protein